MQDAVLAAADALYGFLAEQIGQRRATPGDDLHLAAARGDVDGRPYSEDEILDLCFFLLIAGIENTAFRSARRCATSPSGPTTARRCWPIRRSSTTSSSSRCGCTRRSRRSRARRRATRGRRSAAPRPASVCCSCSARRTATRRCSRTPTSSTSTGATAVTWRSGSARTAAWARTWRASRCASQSRSCCGGCPTIELAPGPIRAGMRPARSRSSGMKVDSTVDVRRPRTVLGNLPGGVLERRTRLRRRARRRRGAARRRGRRAARGRLLPGAGDRDRRRLTASRAVVWRVATRRGVGQLANAPICRALPLRAALPLGSPPICEAGA